MTDSNGWPDASKPGVPENPEQDGWHALRSTFQQAHVVLVRWRSHEQCWEPGLLPRNVQRYWDYEGPMHTPAEVAALVAAGQEAMRAQIVGWISEVRDYCISQRDAADNKAAEDLFDALARDRAGILEGIALMPLPSAPAALARIEAEAEARGMERAAGIAEREQEICEERAAREQRRASHDAFPYAEQGEKAGEIAAAIRAAAGEIKG